MKVYIFLAAVAGGATYLITPLIRHLAIKIGAVGEVRARDVHTVPTPRMGGLGMLFGFIVAMMFACRIPFMQIVFNQNDQAWIILIGAILMCLLGMADDLWDLDWMLKLSGELLISVFVAWGGLQIIALPLGSLFAASPTISIAITAFLIVASVNAVNFVDGLDGLASGIVAIGGIAFGIYSYLLVRALPSYASLATMVDVMIVGICVGFLMHNWHPAKLFMGDSGSMLLGYLITCASIVVTGRLDPMTVNASRYLPAFMPILLPILVLFLPVLDMVMAIVRRLRKHQSPMHPDRMHLHHRMLRIGHTVQGAVLILWAWACMFAFGALMVMFVPILKVIAGWLVLAVILGIVTMYPYIKRHWKHFGEMEAVSGATAAKHHRDDHPDHNGMNESQPEIATSAKSEKTEISDAAEVTEVSHGIEASQEPEHVTAHKDRDLN